MKSVSAHEVYLRAHLPTAVNAHGKKDTRKYDMESINYCLTCKKSSTHCNRCAGQKRKDDINEKI